MLSLREVLNQLGKTPLQRKVITRDTKTNLSTLPMPKKASLGSAAAKLIGKNLKDPNVILNTVSGLAEGGVAGGAKNFAMSAGVGPVNANNINTVRGNDTFRRKKNPGNLRMMQEIDKTPLNNIPVI